MLKQWMVVGFFSAPVWGATLSVEADGSGVFSTLADALVVAADGDILAVGPGTYLGPVETLGLGVHIQSTDGAGTTFLDATGFDAVLMLF